MNGGARYISQPLKTAAPKLNTSDRARALDNQGYIGDKLSPLKANGYLSNSSIFKSFSTQLSLLSDRPV